MTKYYWCTRLQPWSDSYWWIASAWRAGGSAGRCQGVTNLAEAFPNLPNLLYNRQAAEAVEDWLQSRTVPSQVKFHAESWGEQVPTESDPMVVSGNAGGTDRLRSPATHFILRALADSTVGVPHNTDLRLLISNLHEDIVIDLQLISDHSRESCWAAFSVLLSHLRMSDNGKSA